LRLFSDKLRLMGIIDALYQNPGQAMIIDYKTSQKTVVTDDMTRQAALYALLYQDRYGAAPEAVGNSFFDRAG
jgi:ATP-dependent exoDNAse (exonuclease V) beta subunit